MQPAAGRATACVHLNNYNARPRIALPAALGYTDLNQPKSDPVLRSRAAARVLRAGQNQGGFQVVAMSSTFDTVANIIAETCDVPRDQIKPESHAIEDLGIDSLDMLDIAFAIDKAFGIKIPLEEWTQEVNDGKATTEQYFVLGNLCTQIDSLVSAKGA